jgi:hypothetical protein
LHSRYSRIKGLTSVLSNCSRSRRLTIPEWLIATAVVLVAAASAAPWYRTRFASDDTWDSNTASAWQASTWWSIGVGIGLTAGVLSVVSSRPHVRWGCAGACAAALGVVVLEWLTLGSLDTGGGLGWSAAEPSSAGVGEIVRDHLVIVHRDGLHQDVGWGLYAGMAAMVFLTLAIAAAARISRSGGPGRRAGPERPPAPVLADDEQ